MNEQITKDALQKLSNLSQSDYFQVLLSMIERNPTEFLLIVDNLPVRYSEVDQVIIAEYIRGKSTLPAIKKYREITGAMLRDAKEYVEKVLTKKGLWNPETRNAYV